MLPSTTEIYGANRDGTVTWRETSNFALEPEAAGRDNAGVRGGTVAAGRDNSGVRGGTVVFGAADAGLLDESGGCLLGLIRDVNSAQGATWTPTRPTLLSQAQLAVGFDVGSFRIDAPSQRLTLSTVPLIPPEIDALPLIDPRRYGDGVAHYAVRVERLLLDGVPVRSLRPILAVFDTGLTGCVFSQVRALPRPPRAPGISPVGCRTLDVCLIARLSDVQSLVDELPELADVLRATPSRSRLASVELELRTESGRLRTLRAGRDTSPLFYSQMVELNWFAGGGPSIANAIARARGGAASAVASANQVGGGGNVAGRRNARGAVRGSPPRAPHVVALGQAFLGSSVLTIDIDRKRADLTR